MKTNTQVFSWGERLALIKHFKPTDEAICATFNIHMDELEVAREFHRDGIFKTADIDPTQYVGLFTPANKTKPPVVPINESKTNNVKRIPDMTRYYENNAVSTAQAELNATVEELKAAFGDRWAICKNTAKNRAQHGLCLTPKRYQETVSAIIANRGNKLYTV